VARVVRTRRQRSSHNRRPAAVVKERTLAMDAKQLGRLHELADYCQERVLSPAEQNEYDNLADNWNEEDLARMRRLNASVNLPEDYDPWQR
jgi:hypothetical protein